jgi:hypothetical protein
MDGQHIEQSALQFAIQILKTRSCEIPLWSWKYA